MMAHCLDRWTGRIESWPYEVGATVPIFATHLYEELPVTDTFITDPPFPARTRNGRGSTLPQL